MQAQPQRENASKQARRKRTSVCGMQNSAQKFDSRTLVHTVGDGVSRSWGPTRDVAHPTCQCRASERAHDGPAGLPERCMSTRQLGRYAQYRSIPTFICTYGRLRAALRPVFLVRLLSVVASKVFRLAAWETPRTLEERFSARDC